MSTVQTSRPTRRVVRPARPALDTAWATVLAELPAEVHPAMIRYIESKREEFAARTALSALMTDHRLRWHQIDRIALELAFSD